MMVAMKKASTFNGAVERTRTSTPFGRYHLKVGASCAPSEKTRISGRFSASEDVEWSGIREILSRWDKRLGPVGRG